MKRFDAQEFARLLVFLLAGYWLGSLLQGNTAIDSGTLLLMVAVSYILAHDWK